MKKNNLPTTKPKNRLVIKFKGIQSSHCITYGRASNKYYNNIWPNVDRTSGLELNLEIIEYRTSRNADRYRKVKRQSPQVKKLQRTLSQRNQWEEDLKKYN